MKYAEVINASSVANRAEIDMELAQQSRMTLQTGRHHETRILVKVPCECITGNIARGRGREPIKHEAQPSALFARDHAPSAIFSVMHEQERYFNWFIVAAFLASSALNDSNWALRSKLLITMLGRSRGKTGEPM